MEEKKKKCCRCNIEKDVKYFYKNNATKDGLNYSCSQCKKEEYDKSSQHKNKYTGISKNPDLWVKNCPSCGETQKFQTYPAFLTSSANNDVCRKCFYNSITQEKLKNSCEYCSKPFTTQNWNSSQKYCSVSCKNLQRTKNATQINNCLYCDKEFIVYTSLIKYYEGKINIGSYCSRKCLCKSNIEKNQINGSLNGTNTKPELKFKQILDEHNVSHIFQHVIEYKGGKTPYKVYDFYIPHKNILIEIDGIYWHGKDKGYNDLNETQKRNRINDRVKNKLAMEKGYTLYRIWEDEIDKFNINNLK